jgi:DNA-binding NarL/FixJ family response regulator
MLIESQHGMAVIGEAANGSDARAIAAQEQPDIILLDLKLRDEHGADILADLFEAAPTTRVILLTGVSNLIEQRRAVSLGAMGLVLKEQAAEVLVKAIEKVYAGEVWLDRTMLATVLSQLTRGRELGKADVDSARIATLTDREREVIALVCEGLQNKTIGQRLYITETTVRHHLTAIFDRLRVTNRLELVIYAYRNNLVTPPRPSSESRDA